MKPRRNLRERAFGRAPWATRLVVVVAVMAIVVLAFGAFYYALVDLTYLLGLLADYASLDPSERSAARDEGVTTIVKALDGFFVGALLAASLGRRAHLCVDFSPPTHGEGLRASTGDRRGPHLRGHDPADGEEAGPRLRGSRP